MNPGPACPHPAAGRLRARIAALPDPRAGREPRLIRIEEELDGVDPLGWLAEQPGRIKGYWVSRGGELEVAALGEADEVKGRRAGDYAACWGALRERWAHAPAGVRYYGGFRFGPWHAQDPSWQPFQAYRFILPEFEVLRGADGRRRLAANLFFRADADPRPPACDALRAMRFPDRFAPEPAGRARGRHDAPDRAHWIASVERALSDIRAGRLDKVVLARRVCFALDRAVNAFTLVHRMREESGRCYLFCGVHAMGHAFVGASPERLYARAGARLSSEAVAGTRPRGRTPEEDAASERALRESPKEQDEHRLVVEGIRRALASLGAEVRHDSAPAVLKLARVQHLVTGIEAGLPPGVGDPEILGALHPTPAVGGHPPGAAMELLRELEPFDRGWYTGPVGWAGPDAAEFAVALRCGLAADNRLCLFSGAGIVRDSDPEAEWGEIESKIENVLAILRAE